jgi:hypothetical protein
MKTQEEKEKELFLNEIFNYGYEKGLDPYAKPISKWLMKKHWSYNKQERKAYNLGYKRGLKVFDKIHLGE